MRRRKGVTIKLYNTVTRRRETFISLQEKKVGIYVCGPTVYDFFHIGNARVFIVFDVIRRYFEHRGYQVTFVQNFTDIEDKMIKRAAEKGITVPELAEEMIEAYFEDAAFLGVRKADYHPRATEFIPEMIVFIEKLLVKKMAYVSGGDVYFSVESFPDYGKLCGQPLEDLLAGARVEVEEEKKHPGDFALWKKQKPGEPAWDSPWGAGRPGWHIECSVMATKYLGESIDIHGGGPDLIFPHHENEIAQSEGATGKKFSKYWMHVGYLNIDREKMSKSKGNFKTIRELRTNYEPGVIRFFMLSAHYRNPLNFSPAILEQAAQGLARLHSMIYNLQDMIKKLSKTPSPLEFGQGERGARNKEQGARNEEEERNASLAPSPLMGEGWGRGESEHYLLDLTAKARQRFQTAMDDDFNTADAVAVLFELAREVNTCLNAAGKRSKETLEKVLSFYRETDEILGFLFPPDKKKDLDAEIEKLISRRNQARQNKNWAEADAIRDELTSRGIILEDTSHGVRWTWSEK